jgi:hypothetical protein
MLTTIFTKDPSAIAAIVDKVQRRPPSMLAVREGTKDKYVLCQRPKSTFTTLLRKLASSAFLRDSNDKIESARNGNVLLDFPFLINFFPPRKGSSREKSVLEFAKAFWGRFLQLVVPGVKSFKLHIAVENYTHQPEMKKFAHRKRGAITTGATQHQCDPKGSLPLESILEKHRPTQTRLCMVLIELLLEHPEWLKNSAAEIHVYNFVSPTFAPASTDTEPYNTHHKLQSIPL